MSFLNRVAPFLREKSEITLTVRREPAGIRVTVIPRLDDLDPDTKDEAKAAFQAAFARPCSVVLPPDSDLDARFTETLETVARGASRTFDELTAYREAVEAELASARKAVSEKNAKHKVATAKKGKETTKKSSEPKASVPEKKEPVAPPPEPDLFSAPTAAVSVSQATSAATPAPGGEGDTAATGDDTKQGA